MALKFQFDHTCFQRGVASANVDVGNDIVSLSPAQIQINDYILAYVTDNMLSLSILQVRRRCDWLW